MDLGELLHLEPLTHELHVASPHHVPAHRQILAVEL
jgi:hypothetical protein